MGSVMATYTYQSRFRRGPRLSARDKWIAEDLCLLYIAVIALTATFTGIAYILFPELGALSHDVFTRPWGKWANQPVRLILTPTLTGIIGTLIARHAPYNVATILLVVGASVAVIALLRSAIAPAMSAGALPLILGVKTWLYPPCILFGVVLLVGVLAVWRRYYSKKYASLADASDSEVDEILETAPRGKYWLAVLFLFLLIIGLASQLSGLRLILFPPLITIAFEMFGHPEICPWLKRPFLFPVACFLSALGGLIAFRLMGVHPVAAVLSIAMGIIILRILDIHMPPALPVALLPFVMSSPNFEYPISVGIGTLVLTGMFLLYQRVSQDGPATNETSEKEVEGHESSGGS